MKDLNAWIRQLINWLQLDGDELKLGEDMSQGDHWQILVKKVQECSDEWLLMVTVWQRNNSLQFHAYVESPRGLNFNFTRKLQSDDSTSVVEQAERWIERLDVTEDPASPEDLVLVIKQ